MMNNKDVGQKTDCLKGKVQTKQLIAKDAKAKIKGGIIDGDIIDGR